MKIVTFNARIAVSAEIDGINVFEKRLPYILEAIKRENPDIIGFQEVNSYMRAELQKGMPSYIFVGGGREKNRQGESSCIAYLKEKFILADCHTFWLSPNPNEPGSRFENQSNCPRVCTSVLLTPIDESIPSFRLYNMHTDHRGQEARYEASKLLLKEIKKDLEISKMPYITTGDYNAIPTDAEILLLSESKDPVMNDLTSSLNEAGTFHLYGKNLEENGHNDKIDYIYASNEVKLNGLKMWDECHNGTYLSDHYPVCADITILK